ncbi:hypothetical protein BD311DRAFT_109037 [Dichomitus squalens]|uniref:Uncharacterized protein n=1 Tax=Dichomitus squalens TaxID=114155 RepID=A0A4Q9M9C4_9APHY|nr:hypothetical protein BD311DRAFT_109037 [Dichomitus squalens]
MTETREDRQQRERREFVPWKRQRLHDRLEVWLSLDSIIELKELFLALYIDMREENEDAARMELAAGESKGAQGDFVACAEIDSALDDLPWKRRGLCGGRN